MEGLDRACEGLVGNLALCANGAEIGARATGGMIDPAQKRMVGEQPGPQLGKAVIGQSLADPLGQGPQD